MINIFTNPKETPAPEGLIQRSKAIRMFSELMFLLTGGKAFTSSIEKLLQDYMDKDQKKLKLRGSDLEGMFCENFSLLF